MFSCGYLHLAPPACGSGCQVVWLDQFNDVKRAPLERNHVTVQLDVLSQARWVERQEVTPRDAMLYALSLGLGSDPLDERQLPYVYEEGLRALPSMAITLCYPSGLVQAYARAGIQTHRILHGEQSFVLTRPLSAPAKFEGVTTIQAVEDKGPGRGLLVHYRTDISDLRDGAKVASLLSSTFCRDAGGAGSFGTPPPPASQASSPIEDGRAPDGFWDFAISPQAALLYRLSGDYNPLHVLLTLARAAGHERPILHGRCTFGLAAHALLREACGYDATRLSAMSARFTGVVYPGETLRTEAWHTSEGVRFRARVLERNCTVLDRGWARIQASTDRWTR